MLKQGDQIVVCNCIPLEDYSEVPKGTYGVVDKVENDQISVTLYRRTRPRGFWGFLKKKLTEEFKMGFPLQELSNQKPYLRLARG